MSDMVHVDRDRFIETIPDDLLSVPLDWLFAEHYRHRQLCKLIETLAQSKAFEGGRLAAVVDFLSSDLPLHVLDEEEDLFPLLRRRALPEDDIERILGLLATDHRADQERVSHLLTGLRACLSQGVSPASDDTLRPLLIEFVSLERRHVALENAIVIPIARLRLRPEDLKALSARLAARRGKVISSNA